jgi:hypothetical protein
MSVPTVLATDSNMRYRHESVWRKYKMFWIMLIVLVVGAILVGAIIGIIHCGPDGMVLC